MDLLPNKPCLMELLLLLGLAVLHLAGGAEYCWESFNATCPPEHVVLMRHAEYGRMQLGRCLTRDYYTGCSANVLEHMDRVCSGRPDCMVDVPDTELHKQQPCPEDLMAYMDADYDCVPVVHPSSTRCQPGSPRSEQARLLSGEGGYIASWVTENTLFGSPSCPWVIQLQEGQRVNITLYDFAAADHRQADASMCTMYASIKEQGVPGTQMTICGGEVRVKPIFISDTNRVEIHLMPRPAQASNPYFLLKYQAIGCGPVASPEGGWTRRVGNKATVACNASGEVWHVVCDGAKWVGRTGNCSLVAEGLEDQKKDTDGPLPYGLILAVIIGVVLGVVIGVCLLSFVVACQRRLRHSKQQPSSPQPCMNTIDKQRMLRTPEYGYAHVWELQQLQGGEGELIGPGGGVKHVDGIPYMTGGQTRLGDHKYESPQFLRIDNTTLGRMQCQYPEYHPHIHHHHQQQQQQQQMPQDVLLDTQVRLATSTGQTECEAHPNVVPHTGPCGGSGGGGIVQGDDLRYTN